MVVKQDLHLSVTFFQDEFSMLTFRDFPFCFVSLDQIENISPLSLSLDRVLNVLDRK